MVAPRVPTMPADERRKESERQFHNQRFGAQPDVRESLSRWYGAVAACARTQQQLVERYGKGGKVLEYGCADGRASIARDHFIDQTASFHGIDISDQAIDSARQSAANRQLEKCSFSVMDAENMTFPDAEFDVVFGSGILHHLDLNRAFSEIARVLRPGGKAIFSEPLGHNVFLKLFRRMTPRLRTADEHPLLMRDVSLAEKYFRLVEHRAFGMTTLLAVPLQAPFAESRAMRFCEQADAVLLRVPVIRKNAWFVLLELTR